MTNLQWRHELNYGISFYITFCTVLMSKDNGVISHPLRCIDNVDIVKFTLLPIRVQATLVQLFIFKHETVLIFTSFPHFSVFGQSQKLISGNHILRWKGDKSTYIVWLFFNQKYTGFIQFVICTFLINGVALCLTFSPRFRSFYLMFQLYPAKKIIEL